MARREQVDLGEQARIPGTEYVEVKFVGVRADTLEPLALGDEVKFTLTGTVTEVGVRLAKKDTEADQPIAKVTVTRTEAL